MATVMAVMTALLCGGVPATASSDLEEALLDLLVDGGIPELKAVLEAGADVRAGLLEGNTALHMAVMLGREPDFIKVLLEVGADPHQRNDHGQTVLMLAERSEYRDELIAMMNTHASVQADLAGISSASPVVGGKCGAFVVYNSAGYPNYPEMVQKDIWSWAWNASSAQAAWDSAKTGCVKRWMNYGGQADMAELYCRELSGLFCTDKADFEDWGVDPDSHNRCGALGIGDDHISFSHYYSGPTHVYRVGKGPTNKAAEQDALRKCRNVGARGRNNPVSNCRILPRSTVCNSP